MTPAEIAAKLNKIAERLGTGKWLDDAVVKEMNQFLHSVVDDDEAVEIRTKDRALNIRTGWRAKAYRSFYIANLGLVKGKDGKYEYGKFEIKEKNVKAIIDYVASVKAEENRIDKALNINAKITDFIINTELTQYQPSVFGGGIEFRIKTKDLETDGIYNPTYGGYIVKLTKLGWVHHEPTVHVSKISALQAAADFYYAIEVRVKELKEAVINKYPELLEMIKEYE